MLTYTGALQDTVSPGSGLLHLGNRWCSPPVEPFAGVGNQVGPGHFTQPDSCTQLDNPADGNLYAYAADSPTNYIDPTGACSLSTIFSDAGAIIGGFGGSWATYLIAGASFVPATGGILLFGVGLVTGIFGLVSLGLCLAGS